MTRTIKLLFAFLILSWAGASQAQLEITINRGETGAQPIAVVPFKGNDGLSTDVASVIEADLVRTGLFSGLPRGDMLEEPSEPAGINFRNWRVLNRESLVIGSLERDLATDNVTVKFYLFDVFRGEQLLGYEMPSVQPNQLRYVAHQIADLIYQQLTGKPGIFNTKIAYVAAAGYGDARRYRLIVSDADGYNPQTVATSTEPLMSPAWSPDRTQLAYVGFEGGRSGIYIHTLATGKVRKLIGEKGINGSPAWSPDGTKLAVTLSFETNPDIYVIDIATGQRTRLTHHYAIDTEAAWAPDGQSIVFTSDRGGTPQIYRIGLDGSDTPTRLTFEGKQNLRASFSPDGKQLSLVNFDGSKYRIGILDLASGSLRLISDGPMDESPSFAPNGAFIVYATQTGHGAELATVTVDGRVRQSLSQPGDVREPAWSPLLNNSP